MMFKKKLSFLFLLIAVTILCDTNIDIKSSVDANEIGLEDTLIYTITLSGNVSMPQPKLPPIDGFDVQGSYQSMQTQIVNMQVTQSLEYHYILVPKRTGKFTIPPLTFKFQGKEIKTTPINVAVSEGSKKKKAPAANPFSSFFDEDMFSPFAPPSRVPRDISNDVAIESTADKREAYEGQQIGLSYNLITALSVRGFAMDNAPELKGFIKMEKKEDKKPSGSQFEKNSKRYFRFPLLSFALFPLRSGENKIDAIKARIGVVDPNMFGVGTREIERSSNPLPIKVLALPNPKPANFKGMVGSYSLAGKISDIRGRTNEPMTLSIHLTGDGIIPSDLFSDPPAIGGFKVYQPKVTNHSAFNGNVYRSDVTYDFVVVPDRTGNLTIPPFEISTFNPIKKAYETNRTPSYSVNVTPGLPSSGAGASGTPLIARGDIIYIETKTLGKRFISPSSNARILIILTILPFFLTLITAGSFYLKERLKDIKTSQGLLSRRYLKKARAISDVNQSEIFYAYIRKGIEGFISYHLGSATKGKTMPEIAEILKERGIDKVVLESLERLAGECDAARFAPSRPTLSEMQRFIMETEDCLNSIEQAIK